MTKKLIIFTIIFFILSLIDLSFGSIFKISFSLILLSVLIIREKTPEIYYVAIISGIILDMSFGTFLGQNTFPILLAAFILTTIKGLYVISDYVLCLIFFVIYSLFLYPITKNINFVMSFFIINLSSSFVLLFLSKLRILNRRLYESRA